jgi:uncharacterized membrane protein
MSRRPAGTDRARAAAAEARETGRIEAFSDGVFAVAITLLVLDLRVPHNAPDGPALFRALLAQWPAYLAFVTSFATIGIMWVNHHRLFTLIRRADTGLLLLNGLLLLAVTFVPFPTALVAEYVPRPGPAVVAAAVFNGAYIVLALAFNLLWHYAASGGRLLRADAAPEAVEAITRDYRLGPPLYAATFLLAFVNVGLSVAFNLALAVFWALPRRTPRQPRTPGGAGAGGREDR